MNRFWSHLTFRCETTFEFENEKLSAIPILRAMENILFTSLTMEQLKSLMISAVQEISSYNGDSKNASDELILTRKEAAAFLKISLPTLWSWTKYNVVSSKKLGKRRYYLKADLIASLKKEKISKIKK